MSAPAIDRTAALTEGHKLGACMQHRNLFLRIHSKGQSNFETGGLSASNDVVLTHSPTQQGKVAYVIVDRRHARTQTHTYVALRS